MSSGGDRAARQLRRIKTGRDTEGTCLGLVRGTQSVWARASRSISMGCTGEERAWHERRRCTLVELTLPQPSSTATALPQLHLSCGDSCVLVMGSQRTTRILEFKLANIELTTSCVRARADMCFPLAPPLSRSPDVLESESNIQYSFRMPKHILTCLSRCVPSLL